MLLTNNDLQKDMFPIAHFIKGFFKNFFNFKISKLAIVSADNDIDRSVVIQRGAKVKYSTIGRHSYIGAGTNVERATIGNFCSIAGHCLIGMSSHTLDKLSTSPIFTIKVNGCHEQWTKENIVPGEQSMTTLGHDVWLGNRVMIKSGVHIGNGAVIGAGAVVVKDIPPFAVAVGVPAKVVKYRFDEETIAKIEELKWWDMSDEELKGKIELFQTSENVKEIVEEF